MCEWRVLRTAPLKEGPRSAGVASGTLPKVSVGLFVLGDVVGRVQSRRVTPALGHSEDRAPPHHPVPANRRSAAAKRSRSASLSFRLNLMLVLEVWMSPSRSHASRLGAENLPASSTTCPLFASRIKRKGMEVV
jgi:hypothetical protein